MIQNFFFTLFAYYNCDAYGANAYNSSCAAPVSGGGLIDTGYNIIIPVAFSLALIIAAGIWLFKIYRRKRKNV